MRNDSRRGLAVRAGFEFGPSRYLVTPSKCERIEVAADRSETRRQIRERCPRLPGVYAMLDRRDRVIYVGMSGKLRSRLLTYFYDRTAEVRQQTIADHAEQLVWEAGPHELLASLREFELIRRFRPRFNVHGQPGRRRGGYLYITPADAPHFQIDRVPARGARHCWGPVPLNFRSRQAVERLNHWFKLRDCSRKVAMHFPEQQSLFPQTWPAQCSRAEGESCLAPCTGICTREQYERQLAAARQLLDGGDARELNRMIERCERAALRGDSEQAALRYQMWESLLDLCEQIHFARDVTEKFRFVYTPVGHNAEPLWIPIVTGQVCAVVQAPHNPDSARQCYELLETLYGHQAGVTAIDDLEQIRLVVSWFRRHPEQRLESLSVVDARSRCDEAMTKSRAA